MFCFRHACTFIFTSVITLLWTRLLTKTNLNSPLIPSTTLIGTCTGMSIDRDQLIHHRSASTAVVEEAWRKRLLVMRHLHTSVRDTSTWSWRFLDHQIKLFGVRFTYIYINYLIISIVYVSLFEFDQIPPSSLMVIHGAYLNVIFSHRTLARLMKRAWERVALDLWWCILCLASKSYCSLQEFSYSSYVPKLILASFCNVILTWQCKVLACS